MNGPMSSMSLSVMILDFTRNFQKILPTRWHRVECIFPLCCFWPYLAYMCRFSPVINYCEILIKMNGEDLNSRFQFNFIVAFCRYSRLYSRCDAIVPIPHLPERVLYGLRCHSPHGSSLHCPTVRDKDRTASG